MVGAAARRSGFFFFTMRQHTFSTITLNEVKRIHQGIRVSATICHNYGKKNDYSVLIKDAPKGLDLRLPGERDFLCILVEKEIDRLRTQFDTQSEKKLVTNCRSSAHYEYTDLCKACGEHSTLIQII